jgi:hypothetical protein
MAIKIFSFFYIFREEKKFRRTNGFLFLWFPFGVESLFVDNFGSIATSSSENHGGGRTGVCRCTIKSLMDKTTRYIIRSGKATMKNKVGFFTNIYFFIILRYFIV